MLFATPIVKEQVKLDSRFAGQEKITDEDLATIAMERRGLRDLELMRHVNSMLKEAGSNYIAMRLYNGSAERLWLDCDNYTGESSIWKYPPDLFFDPGQWSVVIAKGSIDTDRETQISFLGSELTLAYRGSQSGLTTCWRCEKKNTFVSFPTGELGVLNKYPISAAKSDHVATIQRGHVGSAIVVDGIYTTWKQFPHPNRIL